MKGRRTPSKKPAEVAQGRFSRLHAPPILFEAIGLWLLMFSTTPFFLVERIPLIDFPDRSLLGGGVWDPLLATVFADQNATEVPFWFGTLVVAILLSTVVRRALVVVHWPIVLMSVVGLACTTPWRTTLFTIVCAWLATQLVFRAVQCVASEDSQLWQTVRGAGLVLLLAILTSLEFGLIAVWLTLLVIFPAVRREYQARRQIAVVFLALLAWSAFFWLPALLFPGYLSALVRPISWIAIQPPRELLPSMCLAWEAPGFGWTHWLALALPAERWRQAILGRLPRPDTILLALLTILLLGCSRYTWLAATAILMATQPYSTTAISAVTTDQTNATNNKRRLFWAAGCSLVLGMVATIWMFTNHSATVLASDAIQRRVDVAQWRVSGTVLLTNLEQSSDWQHPELGGQYQPILTDRWDALHWYYDEYLAVCHEWRNWQREAYLRSSGEWGGYQPVFSQWKPVLVAVDSSDLPAIHRVSLDSKWKPIGIDHQRTIFAQAEAEDTHPYVRFANQTLLTLEIPRPSASLEFDRVVVPGSESDARQVSAVLTSMRLPYAASRVLSQAQDPRNTAATIFAQSELGHRSHRYSGQFSLLDCARALGNRDRLRGDSALIAQTIRYRSTLSDLVENSLVLPDEDPSPVAQTVEQQVRAHLALGKLELAAVLIQDLAEPEKVAFYSALASVQHQTAEQILASFQAALPHLSATDLAAECNFYIGCLAVEVGDVDLAQNALTAGLALDPQSPFREISKFYLAQMNPW